MLSRVLRCSAVERGSPLFLRWSTCSYATAPVVDASVRLGWVGTGIMGRSMCQNLLGAGFTNLSLYNRTASKAENVIEEAGKAGYDTSNVRVLPSPKDIAAECDIVFSIVGFPTDVEDIIFNDQTGMLPELKNGKIFVDCTTSKPSLAKEISTALESQGAFALDAPVSGGDVGAKNGTLSFMIGGDESVLQRLLPLFQAMGSKYECLGPAGHGQHTKMVNQILIASGMMGLVEGLHYAEKVGLDQSRIIDLLGGGAAGSWSLANYGPRIVKRDFKPGFYIDHFLKDLKIALEEAEAMNMELPGLSLAHSLYRSLQEKGLGSSGTQALLFVLENAEKSKS